MEEPKFVIIESPLAGDVEANKAYAQKALRDSLMRGEAPFASHLLYTEALDDNIPEEREMGIEAGLVIGKHAVLTAVYIDRGISSGMKYGMARADKEGREVVFRQIEAPQEETLFDIASEVDEIYERQVHNHGTEEGEGLACRETVVDGKLKGECL